MMSFFYLFVGYNICGGRIKAKLNPQANIVHFDLWNKKRGLTLNKPFNIGVEMYADFNPK